MKITEQYEKCWKFFCESKWHIVASLAIFALTFLIGFIYPMFYREEIFKFITELMLSLEGLGTLELVWFIFLNNLQASFFAIIFGVFIGIFPLVMGITNGYLLGFVSREAVGVGGIFVLWRLVPHGIFELPAVIFSIGIGLKLGLDLFGNDKKKTLKHNFVEGLRFFVFVVLPLLLIAGIIEGILVGLIG